MKTSESSCSSSALSFCCFRCSRSIWTSEFRSVSAVSNSIREKHKCQLKIFLPTSASKCSFALVTISKFLPLQKSRGFTSYNCTEFKQTKLLKLKKPRQNSSTKNWFIMKFRKPPTSQLSHLKKRKKNIHVHYAYNIHEAVLRNISPWVYEIQYWKQSLYTLMNRITVQPRRSNQSILKEISPGCSLEGLMLKLKLQYFGHLMRRVDPLEKTLMLGGIGGRRKRGWQRMR